MFFFKNFLCPYNMDLLWKWIKVTLWEAIFSYTMVSFLAGSEWGRELYEDKSGLGI